MAEKYSFPACWTLPEAAKYGQLRRRRVAVMPDRIPAPHFLSYCPSTDTEGSTRRDAVPPCRTSIQQARKTGRKASCLSHVPAPHHSGSEMRKPVAVVLILRFSRRMVYGDNAASKLCAEGPRHTQVRRLSAACLRSTWQEEGRALPVASPPLCRKRHAETVPVSAPSAFRTVAAFPSRAVCP